MIDDDTLEKMSWILNYFNDILKTTRLKKVNIILYFRTLITMTFLISIIKLKKIIQDNDVSKQASSYI